MPMKYSNDTIGNRTRDLPACSLKQLRHRVLHIAREEPKMRQNTQAAFILAAGQRHYAIAWCIIWCLDLKPRV